MNVFKIELSKFQLQFKKKFAYSYDLFYIFTRLSKYINTNSALGFDWGYTCMFI